MTDQAKPPPVTQPLTTRGILDEFKRLSAEIETLQTNLDHAQQAAADAQQRARDLSAERYRAQMVVRARFSHHSDDDIDRRLAEDPEVSRLSAAADAAELAEVEAGLEVERLQNEMSACQLARHALRGGDLDAIRPFAEAVAERRAEVAFIQARLAAIETDAARLTAPDALTELDAERARVLVAVELGEVEPAALTEVEKRRRAAAKDAEQIAAERERLVLLRRGLTERLERASADLDQITTDGRIALQRTLLGHLDQCAPRFVAAAEALHALQGEMIGYAAILQRLDRTLGTGYARGLGIEHLGELQFPMLRIKGRERLPRDSSDWRARKTAEALDRVRGIIGDELI